MRFWVLISFCVVAGCAASVIRNVAPEARPPVAGGAPRACPPLGGEWVHRDDPSYRYLATDDGGTLTLDVVRLFPLADGGTVSPTPTARVVLAWTDAGFVGQAQGTVAHPQGRPCEAEFLTAVTLCREEELVLRSQAASPKNSRCESPWRPRPGASLEHRLMRVTDTRVTQPDGVSLGVPSLETADAGRMTP